MRGKRGKSWTQGPTSREECDENARFLRIDAAFRAGELATLREAVGEPEGWLKGVLPPAIGASLEYAIYHSPLAFIETLLDLGADANPGDHAGFPPLIAALSCTNEHPGAKARPDLIDVLELLLVHGADPDQRGLNDYTPLHMAVSERNVEGDRASPLPRRRPHSQDPYRRLGDAAGYG